MNTPGLKIIRRLFLSLLMLAMFLGVSVQAHASWVKNSDGTYSYYKANGTLVKDKWIGKKYYVDSDGVRLTGRQQIGSRYYYFSAPVGKVYKNKWITRGEYKYYASADGSLYAGGIYEIGGHSYLFNKKGVMLTGKQTFRKKTYYFNLKNGQMLKDCWVKMDQHFFYFGEDGTMVKSKWLKNYTYYVNSKGYRLSNKWKGDRYLGSNGKACTGLQEIDGEYYYFDSKTRKKAVSTSIVIDGVRWQFDSDGKGTKNAVPAPGAGVNVESTYYTHPLVDDETLLSYIIYCEAGNQPYEGQLAVGYVIMNRVYSNLFRSSTVREVVYERRQFNPTWDGAMDRVYKNPSLVTAQCKKAARQVMKMKDSYLEKGKKLCLKLNGKKQEFPYLFFMTPGSYAGQGLSSPYIQIGGHVFFTVWK